MIYIYILCLNYYIYTTSWLFPSKTDRIYMLIESFLERRWFEVLMFRILFPGVMQPIWWCFLCLGLGAWFPSANWVEKKSANLIKMCAKSTWKKVSAERLESSIDLDVPPRNSVQEKRYMFIPWNQKKSRSYTYIPPPSISLTLSQWISWFRK